jgi:phage gp29-like protein
VKQWKEAWMQTSSEDDPRNWPLQLIYQYDAMQDALLTSQLENRVNKSLKTEFSIKAKGKDGKKDDEQTERLANSMGFRTIFQEILETPFTGYSLMEMSVVMQEGGDMDLVTTVVPRTNVVPRSGKFYFDYTEDKFLNYREIPEFGSYILEVNTGDVGKLNKAVPHILFKKFALSCWSELCEIFGIPPRVMKTDTQNTSMLNRAVNMMKDMGAAAWYIIDESEKMEWADGINTNGDVFNNLKNALNNEISMLISGAIIGQDTVNGNRSKDESAQKVLDELVVSDLKRAEMIINSVIIPALVSIGFLKGNIKFEFDQTEDLATLWTRTKDSMSEFDVDPEFIRSKFGVQVIGAKKKPEGQPNKLIWNDPFV